MKITKATQRIIDAAETAGIEATVYPVNETLAEIVFVKGNEAAKLYQEHRLGTGRTSNFATGPQGAITVRELIKWITN